MTQQAPAVTFTPDTLAEVEALHDKAVQEKQTSFVYRGREYSVRYTAYLLHYLEKKFNY